MSGFLHFLKTILIPLVLALLLYTLTTHLLLPFLRRQHSRRYLPLSSLPSLTPPTLSSALSNLLVPSWARRNSDRGFVDDEVFDEEEGEGMVGFEIDERRRGELRGMDGVWGAGAPGAGAPYGERLGRELEEGFRDDSDGEEEHGRERRV